LVDGWMAVRKVKKGANTKAAFDLFHEQLELSGRNINDILKICVMNNWLGFRAEWVEAKTPSGGFTVKDLFGDANNK